MIFLNQVINAFSVIIYSEYLIVRGKLFAQRKTQLKDGTEIERAILTCWILHLGIGLLRYHIKTK